MFLSVWIDACDGCLCLGISEPYGFGSECWRNIGRIGTESLWTCVSFSFSFSFLFPILPSVSSSFSILLSSVVVAKWIRCGAADVDHQAAGDPSGKNGRCCPSW